MTRLSASVGSAAGLTPHSHLCWGYRSRTEFRTRAREFMADGMAAGQWIDFVGGGSIDQVLEELLSLDDVERAVDDGDIGFSSVWDFYRFSSQPGVVDPVASVATRISAAQDALAAATGDVVLWSTLRLWCAACSGVTPSPAMSISSTGG